MNNSNFNADSIFNIKGLEMYDKMNPIDVRIRKFIAQNQTLTLATCQDGAPYCCSLFYAFDESAGLLYFMSSRDSRHSREMISNSHISGTILNAEQSVMRLQGIQFSGEAFVLEAEMQQQARKIYLQKYPVARLNPSELWYIRIDWIKMTDNTLGFGTKLIWEREIAFRQAAS